MDATTSTLVKVQLLMSKTNKFNQNTWEFPKSNLCLRNKYDYMLFTFLMETGERVLFCSLLPCATSFRKEGGLRTGKNSTEQASYPTPCVLVCFTSSIDFSVQKNKEHGAGEMAQHLKYITCILNLREDQGPQREDQGSHSQNSPVIATLESGDRSILRVSWLVRLAILVRAGFG